MEQVTSLSMEHSNSQESRGNEFVKKLYQLDQDLKTPENDLPALDGFALEVKTAIEQNMLSDKELKSLSNKFNMLGKYIVTKDYKDNKEFKEKFKLYQKGFKTGNFQDFPISTTLPKKPTPTLSTPPVRPRIKDYSKVEIRNKSKLLSELEKERTLNDYSYGESLTLENSYFVEKFAAISEGDKRKNIPGKYEFFIEQKIIDALFEKSDNISPEAQEYLKTQERGDASENFYIDFPAQDYANENIKDKILMSFSAPKHSYLDTDKKIDVISLIHEGELSEKEQQIAIQFYERVLGILYKKFDSKNEFYHYSKDLPSNNINTEFQNILDSLTEIEALFNKYHHDLDTLTELLTKEIVKENKNVLKTPHKFSELVKPPNLFSFTQLKFREKGLMKKLSTIIENFDEIYDFDIYFEGYQVKSSERGFIDHLDKNSDVGVIKNPYTEDLAFQQHIEDDSKIGNLVTKRISTINSSIESLLDI